MAAPTPRRAPFWAALTNSFAAGVAIVLPFAVTIWLVASFVRFVDGTMIPLLPADLRAAAAAIPGIGVVLAVTVLTLTGALTANFAGRLLVRAGERIVNGLPIVRSVYGGTKQVLKQIAEPESMSFKEAVLVEFPSPGTWAIGFVTNETVSEVAAGLGPGLVAVYVPQAPIPTSGFLLYAPRAALKPLGLGPEEALKRVISLGIVKPATPPPGPG